MILALLIASASFEDSPKVEAKNYNADIVCAAAMARYGNQPPNLITDEAARNASLGAMQFFLGRLSAIDSHTDWAKLMSTRVKQMSFAEAAKLAPACFSRALNLPFGDDALTRENGR